jgi:hypothetical protein
MLGWFHVFNLHRLPKSSDLLLPSSNGRMKDVHLARFNIARMDKLGPSNVNWSQFGALLIHRMDSFSETNHSLREEGANMTTGTRNGSSSS